MSLSLPSRKLVSQDDGALVQRANVPRSKFQGSWSHLKTFDAGYLYPFFCEEVLPGDHWRIECTAMVRIGTMLFPMMSNQRLDSFFFFVPNRLVFSSWEQLMGSQEDPDDSIDFTVPITESVTPYDPNSIFDHFGIPCAGQATAGPAINVLPLRGYNLIWNEFFRDQNLQPSIPVERGLGPDSTSNYELRLRAKSHDYFTSGLPWQQKFAAPNVPILGEAPIRGLGFRSDARPAYAGPIDVIETSETVARPYEFYREVGGSDEADQRDILYAEADADAAATPLIFAELATATGVSVNQFRQAFLIQQLLERDARGGTRYIESIFSHYGVRSPDARLQRPEYIGGGSSALNITPVAQTAPAAEGALGALGAAGTAVGRHSASFSAVEHGYIIGLVNIKTELAYQQGLRRHWSRRTRYDFYFPSLAGLGEQAVLMKELYCTGVPAEDDVVFCYQERNHEYRVNYSEVTGMFRSTTIGAIDQWHLAQEFEGTPELGSDFIEDRPPMARVLAAGEEASGQQYLGDFFFRRTVVRPVPTFGTPVTLGRY